MNRENYEVKETLTFDEFDRYVNLVADAYFTEEQDEIVYNPIGAKASLFLGFFKICIINANLSPDDYEDLLNDYWALDLFNEAMKIYPYLSEIKEIAKDMSDYRKQKLLNNNSVVTQQLLANLEKENELLQAQIDLQKATTAMTLEQEKVLEYTNKVNSLFTPEEQADLTKKIANKHLSVDKMSDIVVQKFIDTDFHHNNLRSIIDEKNSEITELSQYKHAVEAKNVMAGDKVVSMPKKEDK